MKSTNEMFAKNLIENLTDEELELFINRMGLTDEELELYSDFMDTLRAKSSDCHNEEFLQELWNSYQEIGE